MRRFWLSVLYALLFLGFAYLLISKLPVVLVDKESTPDADYQAALNSARTAVVQLIAGAGIVVGLWFTGKTYRLTKESQRTDRFAEAIKGIGDSSPSVRAGSIYTLLLVAREAPKDWDVIEPLLSGFIRDQATTPNTAGSELRTDIVAALRVVGARPERGRLLSLQGSHIEGADLSNLNLEHVSFKGCALEGATFTESKLANAPFEGATLNGCTFHESDLSGTTFKNANLRGADFYGATIENVGIEDADMSLVQNLTAAQRGRMIGTPRVEPPSV